MIRLFVILALLIAIFAACRKSGSETHPTGSSNPEWPAMKKMVREKFPDVTQMSTAELAGRLSQADRPLLIDARSAPEYDVSHLPGALRAENEAEALEALKGIGKDRPIVIYCSIGYRSSMLARQLKQSGFENVKNLEGSIFEWANEGREVVRDNAVTRFVHPFDEKWGRLLDRNLWSFEPR